MPIISMKITKTIDEREGYGAKCIVVRWSNSEV